VDDPVANGRHVAGLRHDLPHGGLPAVDADVLLGDEVVARAPRA
jgi:hypothetical protein